VHETQEEAMPAHVWQLHLRPGMVQDFRDILSSLVELARQQDGYRGVLALASGKSESPDVTLVALWDSLETIRGSENNLFSPKQFLAIWCAVKVCRTLRYKSCWRAISSQAVPAPRRELRFGRLS